MEKDHVETILDQWKEQRPELDCSPVGVIGRLFRAEKLMRPKLSNLMSKYALTAIQFDIMATLRRNNKALTPTALYQHAMLSSGAMTTNLDKLEQRGLIERLYNSKDRRSCEVGLTERGFKLIEEAYVAHLKNEESILCALSDQEQKQLAHILQRWLLANE